MKDFLELKLKSEILAKYGLPDIPYPIPKTHLQSVISESGEIPLASILYGLQKASREDENYWQRVSPAMVRLAELLAPEDLRDSISATGDNWWLEVGPVNLNDTLVTIQRRNTLIAAITPLNDGRLRVAVFQPLDAKSLSYLMGLSQIPGPKHGVCMRENNWEYALDCSAGIGNWYASDRGESYLSYWEKGLGLSSDGTEIPVWRNQLGLIARPAAQAITEIGVYYTLLDSETETSDDHSQLDSGSKEPSLPTWKSKRHQKRTIQGKFLGCVLGGAVGDAVVTGKITDVTQMTLFTIDGLIRGWVRGCFKGVTDYSSTTAHAYLRWLKTQGERPVCNIDTEVENPGWLFNVRQLHNRRSPNNTCISSLKLMKALGMSADNESKGCKGIARVAPVGLFFWRLQDQKSPQEAFRVGAELVSLTHGHPTAALSGGVLAVLILVLTDGATLGEALTVAKALLRTVPNHEETLYAIERAEDMSSSGLPPEIAIAQIGQGWMAEEALAIAIYCALVARNFKHGVTLATNHDGNSASTGALAGNILGTMRGIKAIPEDWLVSLELRDVITELTSDLYAYKDWAIGEYSNNYELNEAIWQKYPGC